MLWGLTKCAEYSRLLLVLGLAVGIGLPRLAAAMAPYLPEMVAVLLALTAFRIGAKEAFGALTDLRWSLPAVLVLQVVLPLALAGVLWLAGVLHAPLGLALVLATSAPALSGAPSLAIILRQDPARVMQVLVLGTAAFPITAFVVLQVAPLLTTPGLLIEVGLRSLAIIALATAVGFAVRRISVPNPTPLQQKAMDGAAILFFALIVIGLMTGLGPVLRQDPLTAGLWALAAFALSFGVQGLTIAVLQKGALSKVAGPLALAAGNRNIALFLIALPPETVAPIMIFIACWQLPMYLTPILLTGLYRRV